MARMTSARRRGLYPEHGPIERFEEEVEVTLSLPVDLYTWLADMVGHNSFTCCVEQAIYTALRCMRASEGGMNLDALAGLVATERRTTPVEAIFGEIENLEHRRAAALLYGAAMLAASGATANDLRAALPKEREDDAHTTLAALKVMFQGRDFEAEMDAWREEELKANPSSRRQVDFDDEIPF